MIENFLLCEWKETIMAQAGDELISSTGGRLLFCKTAQESSGDLLEVEVFYPPQSNPPPEHYHPFQEERFQVVSGEIRAQIGKTIKTYRDGDDFTIPAGVPHWMHNVSKGESHVIWQTYPVLRTETFFETMWGLNRDKKVNTAGVPNLLQLAVIMQDFAREFRPVKPPFWVQKVVFGVLAPIGRIFGYRAIYDRYSAGYQVSGTPFTQTPSTT